MSDCECYHEAFTRHSKIGVCWGTRECDHCLCGGDESKCDFYPEKRKAKLQTNADRIRAMGDEELAATLYSIWNHESKWYKPCVKECLVPFYKWLKQESGE